MPGLIRGVARVAVVSGTATAVSNSVSRKQAQRWAHQGPPVQSPYSVQVQPAPPGYGQPQYAQKGAPPPAPQYVQSPPEPPALPAEAEEDVVTRLGKLAKLKDAGIITEEDFNQQKTRILAEL